MSGVFGQRVFLLVDHCTVLCITVFGCHFSLECFILLSRMFRPIERSVVPLGMFLPIILPGLFPYPFKNVPFYSLELSTIMSGSGVVPSSLLSVLFTSIQCHGSSLKSLICLSTVFSLLSGVVYPSVWRGLLFFLECTSSHLVSVTTTTHRYNWLLSTIYYFIVNINKYKHELTTIHKNKPVLGKTRKSHSV